MTGLGSIYFSQHNNLQFYWIKKGRVRIRYKRYLTVGILMTNPSIEGWHIKITKPITLTNFDIKCIEHMVSWLKGKW